MHEGSIQSGSLLTGYALKYIICHIQYGFTHSYCFILTLPILLLLLPGFFNYFKGILENPLTYDNFLLFISADVLRNITPNSKETDSLCACWLSFAEPRSTASHSICLFPAF